jgi:ABC-type sugar transport system ATPase subunit
MAHLCIRNAVKRFGSVEVIHGINLDIPADELTVLLGPSGCGKSTVLRMIAGLEDLTEGEIAIDGVVVNEIPAAKRGCAMVFQNYALYPHKTVYRNMAFPLRMAGRPRSEIDERVRRIAAMLEIEPYLDRLPRDLSGGQRQRVAMGRAMIREPKVYLFDEPLSNLDAELRVKMRLEISRLRSDLGATMVFVTHDQVEAMTLAHRIVVMRNGHVEQVGTPLEVYRKPANRFVAGFVGTPAMSFLPVQDMAATESGTDLVFEGGVRLPLPYGVPERPAVIGLRPEHINLDKTGSGNVMFAKPVPVRVLGIEHLGDRSYTHLAAPFGELTVLGSDKDAVPANGTQSISVDPGGLHLFDADGDAIAIPGRA